VAKFLGLALRTCEAHRLILLAARPPVHYMFLVACRRNSVDQAFAYSEKDGLAGICNIALAHPPLNMSLQRRTGIAGPGFDAGFGGLVDRNCFWN